MIVRAFHIPKQDKSFHVRLCSTVYSDRSKFRGATLLHCVLYSSDSFDNKPEDSCGSIDYTPTHDTNSTRNMKVFYIKKKVQGVYPCF